MNFLDIKGLFPMTNQSQLSTSMQPRTDRAKIKSSDPSAKSVRRLRMSLQLLCVHFSMCVSSLQPVVEMRVVTACHAAPELCVYVCVKVHLRGFVSLFGVFVLGRSDFNVCINIG